MKWIFLVLLIPASLFSLEYRMSVRLDPVKKTVSGREWIVWKNEGNAPASFLVFHLYMNAFSSTETVFMRESGARHRGFGFDPGDPLQLGSCRVKTVKVDGRDRSSAFQYLSQVKNPAQYQVYWENEIGEGIRADDTLAVLNLERPVEPGGEVRVEIEFTTKFPRIFARSGYSRSFFMGGQWFPKLAVFEGTKGWNGHFYHKNSEFFADFADYRVELDAPAAFTVGGTGTFQRANKADGRSIWTFSASQVHDFAFTAWDRFQVAEDRWKHVGLRLLYQPGNRSTVARQFRALKAGLDICEYLTGVPYPYTHFTLVDVPFHGAGAGGMEYPMLVTGISFSPFYPKSLWIADMVIIHEFIHNYFQGLVATNEFEFPWMDEGLTSFVTGLALEKYYAELIRPQIYRSAFDLDAVGLYLYRGREYPMQAAWEFIDGYGTMSYNKPSVFLKTIDNLIGRESIRAVFREYFARFRFRHPVPGDFFSILRKIAGETAADLFERGMKSDARVDFSIHSLHSEDLAAKGSQLFDPRRDRFERIGSTGNGRAVRRNVIVAANRGDFALPVTIRAVFAGGRSRDFRWDGHGRWKRIEFWSDVPMVGALVDPEGFYVCDQDLANNAKSLKKRTQAVFRKWAGAAAAAGTLLFQVYSMLF